MLRRLIIGVWLGLATLNAASLHYAKSYEAALAEANASNKMVMVLIVKTYCPWCHKMQEKTLTDESIVEKINAHFVPVILNKEEVSLPDHLFARFVPTTYFLTPGEEELNSAIGYWGVSDFHDYLDDAIDAFKAYKP